MTRRAVSEATPRPCAHCGGPATLYHRDDTDGWSNTDWVCCDADDCGCQTALEESPASAIAAWNRRAPDPERDELIAALRAMHDHFGVLEDNPMLNADAVAASKAAGAILAKVDQP